MPETVIAAGQDSFVVEHNPPASGPVEYHRYALVDIDMAIWVNAVGIAPNAPRAR